MPEGPEVAVSVNLLSKYKGYIIDKVDVISGKYKTKQTLEGLDLLDNEYKIKDIECKGKFMWITAKATHEDYTKYVYIMCTFGMTGTWSTDDEEKNIRVRFELSKGDKKVNINYVDARSMGTIKITDDKKKLQKKINSLELPVLTADINEHDLYEHIVKTIPKIKNMMLVDALMEQDVCKGLVSGIGNYLVAEIMYDAKLSPKRKLDSLSDDDIKQLSHSIIYLITLAYVDNKVGYMEEHYSEFVDKNISGIESGKFPRYHPEIKFPKGATFEFKVYRQKKDPDGNKVTSEEIRKGRTTHWVKNIQV